MLGAGALAAADFVVGAGLTAVAADPSDRIIYDSVSGGLFYDKDGNGATVAVRFATLTGAPAISATDFIIGDSAVKQTGFSSVDASGMAGFGVEVIAATGTNILVGSDQDDVFLYVAPVNIPLDVVIGGGGNDVIRFTSVTAGQILVVPVSVNVEEIQIADAAGLTTGVTKLSLNAKAEKTAVSLVGNDGANALTGGFGADTLNGNAGADTLTGGAGNDVYLVDAAADWSLLDQIIDTPLVADVDDRIAFSSTMAGATLLLGAGVKGVEAIYLSDTDFDLSGTTDLIVNATASSKGFTFYGNAGADTLSGGKFNDTFVVKVDGGPIATIDAGGVAATEANTLKLIGTAPSPVQINLAAVAGADQLPNLVLPNDTTSQSDFRNVDAKELGSQGVVVTLAQLNATAPLANKIVGSSQADIFAALTNLALTGDSIDGGGGNDILRFALAAASTMASANTLNVVNANVTNVETVDIGNLLANLNLYAGALTKGIHLIGNDGFNLLTGGLGDDTINGNADDTLTGIGDTLRGGAGNDVFEVDSGADWSLKDTIDGGAGDDVLRFITIVNNETLVLTDRMINIESVRITDADGETTALTTSSIDGHLVTKSLKLFGNDGDNMLQGGKAGDRIEGGKGTDTIVGGLGSDTIALSIEDFVPLTSNFDQVNAGSNASIGSEKNLLVLIGDATGKSIEIDLGASDQIGGDGFFSDSMSQQTGFWNVDGTPLTGDGRTYGITVLGSARPESMRRRGRQHRRRRSGRRIRHQQPGRSDG